MAGERFISEHKSIPITSLWYQPKYNTKIDNLPIDFSCEIAKAVHKQLSVNGISAILSHMESSTLNCRWYNTDKEHLATAKYHSDWAGYKGVVIHHSMS